MNVLNDLSIKIAKKLGINVNKLLTENPSNTLSQLIRGGNKEMVSKAMR